MAVEMSYREFESLVDDALDSIPEGLVNLMDNCVIVVEAEAPPESPNLLGLYEGIPLTERNSSYGMVLPDRITIFMRPTLEMCHSREGVVKEVYVTVVHEIAHHFGIDDQALHDLGYA